MATHFSQLAGVDHPIVAFSHCRDVVAAVSRAGGLGVLGAAKFTPEELEIELGWIDAHVNGRPYGVDVLAPAPNSDDRDTPDLDKLRAQLPDAQKQFIERIADKYHVPPPTSGATPSAFSGAIVSRRDLQSHIDIALRHPIRFLVSGLGPFAPDVVTRAREANVLIGGMCGSIKHARLHIKAGADVIIAQGAEAAGHTGELSTLVLVPQIVDTAGSIPVLAAGGIVTGRQLAAVLALGAQGAWMGSAWLTSEESDVDPVVIEKLLAADSTRTIRTRCVTGKPARVLRTAFEEEWASPEAPPTLPAPLQGLLVVPIIHRAFQNRVTPLMGYAVGQAVGLMNNRRTCRAIIDEIVIELIDSLENVRHNLGIDV